MRLKHYSTGLIEHKSQYWPIEITLGNNGEFETLCCTVKISTFSTENFDIIVAECTIPNLKNIGFYHFKLLNSKCFGKYKFCLNIWGEKNYKRVHFIGLVVSYQ